MERKPLLGDTDDAVKWSANEEKPLTHNGKYGTANGGVLGLDSVSIGDRGRSTSSMIQKCDRLSLSWSGVNVFADVKKDKKNTNVESGAQTGKKHILKDVYGVATPGSLIAIMGSSGAGKTSMLNVLTKRNLGELTVDGSVRINGEEVTRDQMRLCSAYVQQDDLFIPTLTVYEHLTFNALLRMGRTSTARERKNRVEDVITQLNLTKCQHSLIGDPMRSQGISGGERKRLAFASELLTNPALMFCDEPTSGLDSFMAFNVVSVLRREALTGKTIVCTIHQPSSQVFALFDQIYLMAEGRVAFAGRTRDAMAFFERVGYPSPGNFNPADHYIRVLAVVPRHEKMCRKRIEEVCATFAKGESGQRLAGKAIELRDDRSEASSAVYERYESQLNYRATWCQQFATLLKRSTLGTIREPLLMRVRTFQVTLIAFITGLIYVGSPMAGPEYIMNTNGILFQIVTNMTFSFLFAVVNTFCDELPIFLREHFSGLYRVDTYFLAKILADMPLFIILPFIFTTIVYWMSGLYADFGVYVVNVVIAILTANVAISIGYLISCATGNVNLALSISPVIVIPLMLFGGFYMNSDTVPIYFVWLEYLSYFKYSYEALAINQWEHIPVIPGCANATCAATGTAVLDSLAFSKTSLVPNILILAGMIVVIRGGALVALQFRARFKK